MLVGKVENNNKIFPISFIGGTRGQDYELSLELMLLPGTYYIMVEFDWEYPAMMDTFVIS